jgi:hypothetical protein
MKIFIPVLFLIIIIGLFSCKVNDDIPPILTLTDSDTLYHALNAAYVDKGAKALDDTDGDISKNIYIDNQVDENKIGEYTMTYHVIDQAGNEAQPLTRWVFVYNQGYVFTGNYSLKETQVYPENLNCQYEIATNVDSTINFGLTFSSFACNFGDPVFAQVNDTTIILPYQILADSLTSLILQGHGYINDSLIYINYTLTKSNSYETWNATFERLK